MDKCKYCKYKLFVNHIESHLNLTEKVMCKICDLTIDDIINLTKTINCPNCNFLMNKTNLIDIYCFQCKKKYLFYKNNDTTESLKEING